MIFLFFGSSQARIELEQEPYTVYRIYPHETANAESAWPALVCMYENSHVQSSVPASSSQAPPPPPLALRELLRETELHTGTSFQLLCLATLLACPCLFVCLFLLFIFLKPTL